MREKLIELLDGWDCPILLAVCEAEALADYLIENGVTVQKKAYWKPMKVYVDECVCSECGNLFPNFKSEYCCDCGAKMVDAPKDGDT